MSFAKLALPVPVDSCQNIALQGLARCPFLLEPCLHPFQATQHDDTSLQMYRFDCLVAGHGSLHACEGELMIDASEPLAQGGSS